jgi:hypothetical protein
VDSSDEDESGASSGDELDAERRGRGRTRKGSEGVPGSTPRQAKSLLAAAEEDRKQICERLKRNGMIEDDPVTATEAKRFRKDNAITRCPILSVLKH